MANYRALGLVFREGLLDGKIWRRHIFRVLPSRYGSTVTYGGKPRLSTCSL